MRADNDLLRACARPRRHQLLAAIAVVLLIVVACELAQQGMLP